MPNSSSIVPTPDTSTPGDSSRAPVSRYPLHITLAVTFTALLLLFGSALIGFNFKENSRIALLAANDVFGRVSDQAASSVAELYGPVQNLVDISSKALAFRGKSPEERRQLMGYLTEALHLNPNIASLYLGDVDGDFFLVRSLKGREAAREALHAPPHAVFAAQSVDRESDKTIREEWLFFDGQLSLLATGKPQRPGYDPRKRDWFKAAVDSVDQISSDFYVFFTTADVGVTMARRLAEGGAVVGADLTLRRLSAGLAEQRPRGTPSAKIAMFDEQGRVIALSDPAQATPLVSKDDKKSLVLPRLVDLADPVYRQLAARISPGSNVPRFEFPVAGRDWLASISELPTRSGEGLYLAMLVPRDELLAEVIRVRDQSVRMSIGLLILAMALALWVSRQISRPLRALAREAVQIREFKLETPVTVSSRISEVDNLASTMAVMKSSIQRFLAISKALSAEKDYQRLLEMILQEARKVAQADAGAVLLVSDDDAQLEVSILQNETTGIEFGGPSKTKASFPPISLTPVDGGWTEDSVDVQTASRGKTIRIDDMHRAQTFDFCGIRERFEHEHYQCTSLLSVPLKNQKDETVGVLQLVNPRAPSGDVTVFRDEIVSYIEALSSEAAIALDNRRLLKAQKDLLDSFIQVVAGAIDAKSPYTHGHCQRVPELAHMLAAAADTSDEGTLSDFRLNGEEWYELHIASWLHDCGKMTTPEYVVDKATKLETIYNRIHEIRTRFEILWRDAELDYYRALSEGAADRDTLRQRLEERRNQIRDDFAFVADCNIGGEFMSEDRTERVKRIASQTWTRHLDDRLGLSGDELQRIEHAPSPSLPVVERLLADKPEHIISRDGREHPFGDNPHGFRMEVPAHLYNHGEVYNLCTQRGTLTSEERFKINEHIIQTIIMLGKLPFPRELRRVPAWAGNHHEKLDGTGYPRRLSAKELSIPERIMAIADIFEALTAADRPYKSAKSLSQSLRIMSFMRNDGHICPNLFDLFLTSGVYLRYAEHYLQPAQIDPVDITQFLSRQES